MAVSFIVKASFQLHCRAIIIPWVLKHSAIRCSRGRDYSAVPVRYIPKESRECQESEAALRRKHFLDLEKSSYLDQNVPEAELSIGEESKYGCAFNSKSQDHKQRLMTSVDDEEVEYRISGTEAEVNADFVLEQGVAQTDNAKVDAERKAVQLLASRALTAVELKKKLLGEKFTLNVVNAVITDFRTRGLINDSLYAEMFSRSRWSSLSWGPRRIKQALMKKGVSEIEANKAIKLVFKNNEAGEEEQESGLAMSRPSLDQLLVQATKQWLKGRDVPKETRKARIIHWLQYRGFDWSVVGFILKKLESSSPQ